MFNNIHPGIVIMLFGLIAMAIRDRKARSVTALIGSCLAFVAFINLSNESSLTYTITDNLKLNIISCDKTAWAFMLAFCVIAVINAIYSFGIQERIETGMTMIYVGSIMGVSLAGDVLTLIVFWEVSAFASTYIIYAGRKLHSSGACFRYILVHGFGGNMLLVGLIMYICKYGFEIRNISGMTGEAFFWFILIGVAVNAAIPPLNSWLSDAYPESTLAGTVYLASYTTKAAILVLIKFFAGYDALVWIGAIMAVYAACMAILENDIRRLLSYHIVSQLGMMVAALGVGGTLGIAGAAGHAITNIMFKGVLLMGAGAIIYATGKSKITQLGGLGRKMPITSTCFLICSLAIAGLPGLSGFVSKALVTEAISEGGFIVPSILVTVAGVGTLLSITLKINYFVFWGKSDTETELTRPVPATMNAAMIIGTLITVAIGIRQSEFYAIVAEPSIVNAYTMHHVLEYIAVFIGGAIPFFLVLSKMKPHDEITLDFDWFYRRPLPAIVDAVSVGLFNFFAWFDTLSYDFVRKLGLDLGNPYRVTERAKSNTIRKMSWENEQRRIGSVVLVICTVLILMIVVMGIVK